MKRIHDTHPTLRAFGISLLLIGLLGAGAAWADDASGSGCNGEEATQGGMGQEAMEEDCPEEKKDDGECPSDWPSESLGDEMPQENGSTGTTDGTGGTQTEEDTDTDQTGTGGSGGTGTDGTGTDSIGTGGTGSGTGTSGTGSGGTGSGGMGTGGGT